MWFHHLLLLDLNLLSSAAIVIRFRGGVIAGFVFGSGLVGVLAETVVELQKKKIFSPIENKPAE